MNTTYYINKRKRSEKRLMEKEHNSISFRSKVDTGDTNGSKILKIIFLITGIVVIVCLFIKLIMGDLRFSDVKPLIFSLIILSCCKLNIGSKPIQEETTANISFDEDEFCISYDNIGTNSKNGTYSEKTFLKYADIEEIQLSTGLHCFRIVANSRRERIYNNTGKYEVVENPDPNRETFINAEDEDDLQELKKMFEENTGISVKIMEEN